MANQFDLTGPNASLNEEITTRYFICVEKCDQYSARTKIEEKKIVGKESGELNFETTYTPYIVAKASYRIVYLRRNRYGIALESDIEEVQILNRVFTSNEIIKNEIKVDAAEKITVEREDSVQLNVKGENIKFKEIPPHNEVDASFYEDNQAKIEHPKLDMGDIIEKFRDQLVHRPKDVTRSLEETFTAEIQIILRTYYWGIFTEENKEKKMRIDSVTGRAEFF